MDLATRNFFCFFPIITTASTRFHAEVILRQGEKDGRRLRRRKGEKEGE